MYPIGIPVLYAVILWRKRELLNPRVHTTVMVEPEDTDGTSTAAGSTNSAGIFFLFCRAGPTAQTNNEMSPQELQEFKERVKTRRNHPELAPSMFLWKDFGESCETI